MSEPVYHSLNGIQTSLAVLFSFFPEMRILNLALRMDFVSEINEETMFEAVRETVRRVPYLDIRLHKLEDGMKQYICDEIRECELVDLSDRTPEEIDGILYDWTCNAFPTCLEDIPLYIFRLIRMPGGGHTMYFCGQHFIMDGYAMLHVIEMLDKIYGALDTGAELPPVGPTPWKQVEEDWAYLKSERYQRDLKRCGKFFETEPQFTSMNGAGSPEFIEGKRYGKAQGLDQLDGICLQKRIPRELARRINEAAAAAGISPSNYYLMALRSYLAKVSETDDVLLTSSITARRTKYERECGLSLSSQHFVRTDYPASTSFAEAMLLLSYAQNDAYRHPKLRSIDVTHAMNERYGVPAGCSFYSVQYSYLPLFDLGQTCLKFNPRYIPTGQSNQPYYLVILPENPEGDLLAAHLYATAYTREDTVERFHLFMLRFLELALDAPEKAVGTLTDEALASL